ncbi:MAG: antibiotic biosynthesis monooxygenase family protein [Bacillota bacterium]
MYKVLEIARFTIKPELESQFLADYPAFVATVKRHFPGLITTRLARIGGHEYLDVVEWENREQAMACAEQCMQVPEIVAFFRAIDKDLGIQHADLL